MEVNLRKKKKVTVEGDEGERESERLKKLKGKEEGVAIASGSGDPVVATPTPTEEEVEQLYAILRRMKEAVNYFHRKGTGTKEWRHALEQSQVTLLHDAENVDDGAALNDDKTKEVIINEGFDLNALAPEADDHHHGGA